MNKSWRTATIRQEKRVYTTRWPLAFARQQKAGPRACCMYSTEQETYLRVSMVFSGCFVTEAVPQAVLQWAELCQPAQG